MWGYHDAACAQLRHQLQHYSSMHAAHLTSVLLTELVLLILAGPIVCQVDVASGSIALMSQSSRSAMHTHMYGSIRQAHADSKPQLHSKHLAGDKMPASLLKKLGLLDQVSALEEEFEPQHSIAGLAAGTFDVSAMIIDPAALDSSLHLAAMPRPGSLCVPATIQAYYPGVQRVRPSWTSCAYQLNGQSTLSSNRMMGRAEGQVLGSIQDLLAKPLQSNRHQPEAAAAEANILYQTLTQASHPMSRTAAQTDVAVLRLESRLGLAATAMHALAIAQQAQHTAQHQVSCQLSVDSNHIGGARNLAHGPMLTSLLKSAGLECKGLYVGTLGSSCLLPRGTDPIHQPQILISASTTQQIPNEESISSGTSFRPHLVKCQAEPVSLAGSGPFQLLPQPRGALQNLQPVPLKAKVQPGQVWLKTQAVGINFRDVLNVLGMYPGDPGPPGADFAGVVVAIGAGVTDLTPGMAVFGLAPGCLGSHVHVNANCVVPLPAQLAHTEAATIPTVYITAHTAFRQASVVKLGDRVLVHAAAGGVGLAAVQVLAEAQADVFATAGGPSKRSLLRQLRVKHVMDSRSSSMASDVAIMGGVNVVLNSLTSPGMVAGSAAGVRLGGRFVEISKRDIWSPARLAQERPDLHYSLLAVDFLPPSAIHSALTRAAQAVSSGSFCPLPQIMHQLSNTDSALRQMSQARHVGKVVISTPVVPEPRQLRTGSCLVTGGLGSLGSLTAQWLIEHGQQHLTLVGRSGKLVSDAHTFLQMATSSCNTAVTVLAADMSTAEASHSVTCTSKLPLSAVLHASGALADATLQKQSAGSVRSVFAAKVESLQALDRYSKLQPYHLQVLFSSVAAFLGSAGQANYSAANGALDGLAAQWAAQVTPPPPCRSPNSSGAILMCCQ